MKKIFIVANWKSHKTILQTKEWFAEISNFKFQISNKQIIVCPSFSLLQESKASISNYELPFVLGAQDISSFEEGAYTGEVNARQIKEYANYVIIGHSERRENFGESDEMIIKKIEQAAQQNIIQIVCVSDINQIQDLRFKIKDFSSKIIVAYEPISAISTSGVGKADTPENAVEMAVKIKEIFGDIPVVYGGSVTSINVNNFTNKESISGVLVGSGSLDPQEFAAIITHA